MVWTAPRTWVANTTLTAAQLNEQIRDNLLACGPEKAGNHEGYLISVDENVLDFRIKYRNTQLATETTSSGSYTDLTTLGPSSTVNTGTAALCFFSAQMSNSSAGFSCFASVEVSGATSIGASTTRALRFMSAANKRMSGSQFTFFDTLNPGANTFTMKYAVGGGTGTFTRRRLIVLPY